MKALFACEESQACTIAFRKRGIEAFSCDTEPCSGGHPEWHIQDDVLNHLDDGWDLMVGFPPCTYLSSVQTFLCRKDELRVIKRIEGAMFFMRLIRANIPLIAVENPTGIMTHIYRSPDQIIHPYFFGDTKMKRTCLWLKGLPKLQYNQSDTLFEEKTFGIIDPPKKTYIQKSTGRVKNIREVNQIRLSSKERSKLSPFIAQAMAEQWGSIII